MNGTIKAGQLVLVDRGEYSDYSVTGFFVALQDLDVGKELEGYLQEHPEEREEYAFNEDRFLAQLIQGGYLLEIPYANLYLSAYSRAEDVQVIPLPNK